MCSKCGQYKARNEHNKNNHRTDEMQMYCRLYQAVERRIYRQINAEQEWQYRERKNPRIIGAIKNRTRINSPRPVKTGMKQIGTSGANTTEAAMNMIRM